MACTSATQRKNKLSLVMKFSDPILIYPHRAQCPVVADLGKKWRVYYANRDCDNESFISFFEVEAYNPTNIIYDHRAPILPPGKVGAFDEHGQMPTCIVGEKLYYVGWSRRHPPYQNSVGVAVVRNNFFIKHIANPILPPGEGDIFTGTFWVDGTDGYYLSCVGWRDGDPLYVLRHATSTNGIDWKKGKVAVDFKNDEEGGICSATVQGSVMLYCYRGHKDFRGGAGSYRFGMAVRDDEEWLRVDEHIEVPRSDWDGQMQCYPYLFKNYLFYNGNNFGATGIGCAKLQT